MLFKYLLEKVERNYVCTESPASNLEYITAGTENV
jgi:hypothetical protein